MDIWLVYLVKTLLLPISSLLFLAFLGYFYLLKNNVKKGKLLLISLLCLYILSIPFVAVHLGKSQEQYQAINFSDLDRFNPQAIVVIGGGSKKFAPEYSLESTINSRTLLRLRYTANIARKTKLPVLVSGGNVFDQELDSEADTMATVLRIEFNIPVQWLETKSRNTAENAVFTQKILVTKNINSIILVTHAIHMSRAVEQFERVGFKVLPAPTVFLSAPDINLFSFLPSANALVISTIAIHEWLGKKWYRLRYNN